MSRPQSHLASLVAAIALTSSLVAVANADDLRSAAVSPNLFANRPNTTLKSVRVSATDNTGAVTAMLCGETSSGYSLTTGKMSVVLALPKIESVDMISFLNSGAAGVVTVYTSNAKLPLSSEKWQQLTADQLTAGAIQSKIGPVEAKYIKLTFDVSEAGRIAGLNVWAVSESTRAIRVAAVSANRGIESGGKDLGEAKDFKDSKEIPAEAPAEGPPPPLPDPPPFVFIPEIVPTSP